MTVIPRILEALLMPVGCVLPFRLHNSCFALFHRDLEHKASVESLNKPLEHDHRISRLLEVFVENFTTDSREILSQFSRTRDARNKSNFFSLFMKATAVALACYVQSVINLVRRVENHACWLATQSQTRGLAAIHPGPQRSRQMRFRIRNGGCEVRL